LQRIGWDATLGLPTHLAIIAIFRANTGEPLAVMDGRLITELRTAAVSAVATRLLSAPHAKTLAVLGSGVQARAHVRALALVRKFDSIRIWSRNPQHAQSFASEIGGTATSAEDAVRGADVVVTCTNSPQPILRGTWLKPDAMVNAVGAVGPTRRELDDDAMRGGSVVVDSRDAEMRAVAGVTLAETGMNFQREESWFLSSEGARIHQTKYSTGAGYTAYAFAGSEIQKRSYPSSFGGQWQNRGYELIEEMKLVENARRVAEEAVALHSASQCPEGTATIILDGSQLGLQIHESIGHPIELDRVLGMEANFAGTSFLTLEKLGKLRYGSELVNVVADARQEHGPGLGTFAYDDEGVAAQSTPIITNGLFTGYLSSRETAHTIGATRSGGTLRAECWNRLPMIRMTNVSILPGEKQLSLEQLIAATDDGIYMETNKSWSIDDKRYNFQFGCEIAWEIKHGKRVRMLKNPSYSGITTEFWNSMDAICSRDEWAIWGTPNCGKGQPQQVVGTGHGASPARFRNIRVGSAYS